MEIQLADKLYSPQRIFCIGRNYAAHIDELKNERPTEPVVFMKPPTCLVPVGQTLKFPPHGRELHHEAEVVVLVGRDGRPKNANEAREMVAGVALGLDLTLRDVQSELKKKGLPWEKAKAFENSSPIGHFVLACQDTHLDNIEFQCQVNGELRQKGNTSLMLFPITTLLMELGKIWQLREGDLIYTGTPAGVARLHPGDKITLYSPQIGECSWQMEEL
ncbi:MAG: fumarylacetoacetate hydrolase family protein [Calditrichia bacterium]